MPTSDDNTAHRMVIQYCFERSLTPVQTKRENDTNMCLGHWYTPGLQRFQESWSVEQVEGSCGRPTNKTTKNRLMDVIREDRRLTVREVSDIIGIGKSSVIRRFSLIFQ